MNCPACGSAIAPDARFCSSCGQRLGAGAAVTTPVAPAAQLPRAFGRGRYQVERFLGEGSKKRVYLAHDSRLDRDIAFSLIKTDGLDAEGLTRIRREAQAMGRLGDHPHVVTVYDIDEEAGQPCMVSQYMAGGSVEELIQRSERQRVPLERALRIGEEICRALEHAHGHGIIHRDLKPGNVWLAADGSAALGDFGLAVALDRSRLTLAGMMVGTVAYMAPEQALGRPPDARSDLYSLGAMLYEMMTGRPPFLGDDVVAIISQHINTSPVAPSWHNPEVPKALEALILRLLSKAPEDRPENAAAVRRALAAISPGASTVGERGAQADANPLDRLAGGVFVGREKEMDELRAGLEDALSGRGRLLMLVGEPGIGKTRTADELATYARLRNVQVLWGRCYEGEGAPSYWPWVQAIRSYVHDVDPSALLSDMGSGAADIAQVVSAVRERLPGLPSPPALEPEQARFRLFDSITTFLKNAGKRQPLLLVLDDLHWADKPSLLLLEFLVRELRGARVLVLGTYRDIELGRQHPLAQTLGELTRQQLSQRILLRGLSDADVARFIEITAGRPPPAGLVAAVYRETEGNPFFVNEIVRLLVTDGRLQRANETTSWTVAIPQSVREVVGRRLDHLSDECNGVLTVGAAMGREFALDALEQVTGLPGDRVLEALEEALRARVIAEVPRAAGRYSFTHALIRETLYDELSASRRMRLHRQIGEALETLPAAQQEARLGELAHHFFESGDAAAGKAIDYSRRAGERATQLLAYEQASQHYERALQALELVDTPDDGLKADLTLSLGEAHWGAGEYDPARDSFIAAGDLAERLGQPQLMARAALGVGAEWWGSTQFRGADQKLITLIRRALAALGPEDSVLRVRLLARLTRELIEAADWEERRVASDEAVAMARRLGDNAALAYALGAAHFARWEPSAAAERLAIAREIKSLGDEAGDGELGYQGAGFEVCDLLELGEVAAADAAEEALVPRIEALRRRAYRWHLAVYRAMRAAMDGRFDEAERLGQEAFALGQGADPNALVAFGGLLLQLRILQGRFEELWPLVEVFAGEYGQVLTWRCAISLLHAESGRLDDAREQFQRLAAHDFSDLPQDNNWCSNVMLLADVCAWLADRERAARLYDLLLSHAGRHAVIGLLAVSLGAVDRCLATLATTMGKWDAAIRHFEDALEMNTMMGAKHYTAYAQVEYARTLIARSASADQPKALQLLTTALDIAQDSGMKLLVDRALTLKVAAQGITPGGVKTSIDAVASAVTIERPDIRPHAAPDGTVTILFSDIEGSTVLTERLGDQRWLALLRAHNEIIRRQVRAFGGFEVKSQGDGFMIAFQSARRALLCAAEIQRALARYNEEHEERLRVRMGLHTGEAIKETDDFFGKNVILAARIAAQAAGGEILVSSLLKQLTESGGDIRFVEERQLTLKGLAGTHTAFLVLWE